MRNGDDDRNVEGVSKLLGSSKGRRPHSREDVDGVRSFCTAMTMLLSFADYVAVKRIAFKNEVPLAGNSCRTMRN